jgi:hypothetical protein
MRLILFSFGNFNLFFTLHCSRVAQDDVYVKSNGKLYYVVFSFNSHFSHFGQAYDFVMFSSTCNSHHME